MPDDIWTILKVLNWTKDFLASKGVANSRLEAEWMLCAATGLDRVGLYLQYDKPLIDAELAFYRSMVARRAKREPLQHILGTQEFMGIDYEVSRDVLIPRHDTEVLIELAVSLAPHAKAILDIGTGSGCIAVSLAHKYPHADVTATDISDSALSVARRNMAKQHLNIELLSGSLFEPLAGRKFDLIVSNPPYIPTADIAGLEQEVRDFDPLGALDGGQDGLDIYRELIPKSLDYLNPDGWLMLEVGKGQASDVLGLINASAGFKQTTTAFDPGGVERVVAAQRNEIQ